MLVIVNRFWGRFGHNLLAFPVLKITNKFLTFLLDLFGLNPSLKFFFLDLAPDIVYKKAAATVFWYLVRFTLHLVKFSCCYSILGLAILVQLFWNKLRLVKTRIPKEIKVTRLNLFLKYWFFLGREFRQILISFEWSISEIFVMKIEKFVIRKYSGEEILWKLFMSSLKFLCH